MAFQTGMGPEDRRGGLQDQDHKYQCPLCATQIPEQFPCSEKQQCSQWQVTKAPAMLAQGQSRNERSPMGKTSG